MVKKEKGMTGKQKAALLLISLGPEVAAAVYKNLNEEEVERLTLEISSVKKVESSVKEEIIEEFHNIAIAQDYISQGGIGYAKTVLEKALGKEHAQAIINRLTSSLQVRPFDFARRADPSQILNFIQNEHPQTIALILSYLEAQQAGIILSSLPQEMQADIAKRIATMDSTSPEVISEIEAVLKENYHQPLLKTSPKRVAWMPSLKCLMVLTERRRRQYSMRLKYKILNLRKKFVSGCLYSKILLHWTTVQFNVLSVIAKMKTLFCHLKYQVRKFKKYCIRNMSQRMAESFKEEIEIMGPVRLRDVEEAQMRIVGIIRRLEESGEIIIARGGGDDIIV